MKIGTEFSDVQLQRLKSKYVGVSIWEPEHDEFRKITQIRVDEDAGSFILTARLCDDKERLFRRGTKNVSLDEDYVLCGC